jgi:hypothetical protein
VLTAKRYSVPIYGKYLVITANPAEHPMHLRFPVSLPCHRVCSKTTPLPIMSVLTELIGGHFTA